MKTDPWNDIDKLMTEGTLFPKDGWFSKKHFMEKYKCSRSTARTKIDYWILIGAFEKKSRAIMEGKRGCFYRYIKK